ncbi:hypothetical protein ABF58_10845 [Enterobacter hormaechei subsp. steigerwaltii]|nr:hypothetical protein ABF58_10845 [Enterobacter hormaechei subsp. steigerwaltii]
MNHRLAALIQQHNDGITFDDGFFEYVEGVQAFLNVRRGAISFAVCCSIVPGKTSLRGTDAVP